MISSFFIVLSVPQSSPFQYSTDLLLTGFCSLVFCLQFWRGLFDRLTNFRLVELAHISRAAEKLTRRFQYSYLLSQPSTRYQESANIIKILIFCNTFFPEVRLCSPFDRPQSWVWKRQIPLATWRVIWPFQRSPRPNLPWDHLLDPE